MRISLALLADYANVSREGKLNILGVFDNINAPSVPTAHSQMQLVMIVEGSSVDAEKDHQLEIELKSPSGQPVFKFNGKLHFGKRPAGVPVKTNSTIQLNNLIFNEFGKHTFFITIGSAHEEIPFTVVKVEHQ